MLTSLVRTHYQAVTPIEIAFKNFFSFPTVKMTATLGKAVFFQSFDPATKFANMSCHVASKEVLKSVLA